MLQPKDIYKENVDYILQELARDSFWKESPRKKEIRESNTFIKEVVSLLNKSDVSIEVSCFNNFSKDISFFYDIIKEYAERYLVVLNDRKSCGFGILVSYENIYFEITKYCGPRNIPSIVIERVDSLEKYLEFGVEVIPYENILSNTSPDTYEKRRECMKDIIEQLEKAKKVGITKAQLIGLLEIY